MRTRDRNACDAASPPHAGQRCIPAARPAGRRRLTPRFLRPALERSVWIDQVAHCSPSPASWSRCSSFCGSSCAAELRLPSSRGVTRYCAARNEAQRITRLSPRANRHRFQGVRKWAKRLPLPAPRRNHQTNRYPLRPASSRCVRRRLARTRGILRRDAVAKQSLAEGAHSIDRRSAGLRARRGTPCSTSSGRRNGSRVGTGTRVDPARAGTRHSAARSGDRRIIPGCLGTAPRLSRAARRGRIRLRTLGRLRSPRAHHRPRRSAVRLLLRPSRPRSHRRRGSQRGRDDDR